MGAIRYQSVSETDQMYEYIGIKMETREDPNNKDQDQYRNILRVVIKTHLRDVTMMKDFDNSLTTFSEVTAWLNGSKKSITVKPGVGFNNMHVMNQEFVPLSAEGSEFVLFRYELVTVATEWTDINWD